MYIFRNHTGSPSVVKACALIGLISLSLFMFSTIHIKNETDNKLTRVLFSGFLFIYWHYIGHLKVLCMELI